MEDADNSSNGDISVASDNSEGKTTFLVESTPSLAALALSITSQNWEDLGLGSDLNVRAFDDLEITVERVVSLFLIRIVALVSHRTNDEQQFPKYSDSSTTTICREALSKGEEWPDPISVELISQLREYVLDILQQYQGVYYHNFEHAYHVLISCNKLLDMMLLGAGPTKKTYGLKSDPLITLALLFSALVHDVDHKGISNRQLVMESDELAILYNDQSVAEQRSLAVAFSELKKPEYALIRQILFETPQEYRRFRKTVINLVLTTDIASPERTQLGKSKWKEAFGNVEQERKNRRSTSKALKEDQAERPNSRSPPPTLTKSTATTSKNGPSSSTSKPDTDLNDGTENFDEVDFNDLPMETAHSSAADVLAALPSFGGAQNVFRSKQALPQFTQSMSLLEVGGDNEDGDDEESEVESHYDDYSSSSATPESHDDDPIMFAPPAVPVEDPLDGVIQSGFTLSASPSRPNAENAPTTICAEPSNNTGQQAIENSQTEKNGHHHRHHHHRRRSSHKRTPEDSENARAEGGHSPSLRRASHKKIYNRRFSSPGMATPEERVTTQQAQPTSTSMMLPSKRRLRLGLRRSMDLTGQAIEHYQSSKTTAVINSSSVNGEGSAESNVGSESMINDPDDPDEFKASVVMEHLIKAADIGPNMQSWDHMAKWSTRLFYELKTAMSANRGEDPEAGWYENQISFLNFYILPLAKKLDETGVFGEQGPMFESMVEANRDQWMVDGLALTDDIIREWQHRLSTE